MPRRIVLLAVLGAPFLSAQFSGLASTVDGSSLYFASTLRLKNLAQPLNGKIYVFSQNAVSLFRAQEVSPAPPNTPACTGGGFSTYMGAETSSIGVVALSYQVQPGGGCGHPPNSLMTQLVTASGVSNVAGTARLSTGGRYAIVLNSTVEGIYSSADVSFLDLLTGAQTPVGLTPPQLVLQPYTGGRVIANDGTAVLATVNGAGQNAGYIVKPGVDPMPFPIANSQPLIIDASGTKVLYQQQGLNLLDLGTLASTPLIPADVTFSMLGMSDDASRVLYVSAGQVHLLDTNTLFDRTLTHDPATITQATISGNGKIIFAVTGVGRLLKIGADDGSQMELIGRTPYLNGFNGIMPGFTTTLTGSALSDSTINATTVPLTPFLGNVTMWIGQRKVPMVQLTPTSVSIIVPWDIQPESGSGSIRILAEVAGDNTPFYFPEAAASLPPDTPPRTGVILRQDWSPTYVGPINTGEIIHVYAAGFGPVSPEVPDGAAAPSAEPLSRITQSFTCSNAEVLYAGLAPGAIERTYQIDLRIGPTPGYQKFICSLGTQQFIFLTLDIVAPPS